MIFFSSKFTLDKECVSRAVLFCSEQRNQMHPMRSKNNFRHLLACSEIKLFILFFLEFIKLFTLIELFTTFLSYLP